LTILDIRTYMLVIIKLLAVTLGFKWKLLIKNDVIVVNRKLQAAMGVIEKILVVIVDAQTYIPL